MNIVIIPCMKLSTAQFGLDYSKWDSLQNLGVNAWESAVRNVKGADRVMLFHDSLNPSTHQSMEKSILREAIRLHKQGHSVLILEADTFCVGEVNLFESQLVDKLRLFSAASSQDHPDLPIEYNLNSGVVFWPAKATAPLSVLENLVEHDWPETWAYYQFIWNKGFYSQFDSLQEGWDASRVVPLGMYNWFIDSPKLEVPVTQARILHFFTSRGLNQALRLSQAVKKHGVKGYVSKIRVSRPRVLVWRIIAEAIRLIRRPDRISRSKFGFLNW